MARMIDSETAYRFLTGQLVKKSGAFSKGVNKGLNIARSAMRNPDAIPTLTPPNEWISVEERLPEKGKCVLVYATSNIGANEIAIDRLEEGECHPIWVYTHGWFEVTHWMPLPQPPSYLFPEEKKNAPHGLISRSALLRGETEPEIITGSDSELAEHMEWDRWMDKIKRAPAVGKEEEP